MQLIEQSKQWPYSYHGLLTTFDHDSTPPPPYQAQAFGWVEVVNTKKEKPWAIVRENKIVV